MTETKFRRRTLLKAGAAGAAAGTAQLATARSALATTSTPEPVDVLIIGPGYAGAVAALRLAQAGIRSVVLERGRRWPITPAGNTFATQTNLDGRAAWLSTTTPFTNQTIDPFTGVLEAFPGNGVVCLAGAGVGGGSLVNNAVMMTPRRDFFGRSFGTTLDYDEMVQTWYPRARTLIGPEPIPADVLSSAAYGNARQFATESTRGRLSVVHPDLAVDWNIVRNEIAGTAVRSAILGQSIFGTNSGAKRSVDRSILATAEATGLVEVLPLHVVLDLTAATGGGYLVEAQQINENGTVLSRPQFAARYVVLAAGSLGTSHLLTRAKGRGTLPQLNDQVGKSWGSGGDHIVIRAGLPLVDPAQGGPANLVATDWDNPLGPVTLLNFPLGVPQLAGIAREMLAVTSPPPAGSFSYSAATGKVTLDWPATAPAVAATTAAVKSTAATVRRANPLLGLSVVTPLLTSHSLGGCVHVIKTAARRWSSVPASCSGEGSAGHPIRSAGVDHPTTRSDFR